MHRRRLCLLLAGCGERLTAAPPPPKPPTGGIRRAHRPLHHRHPHPDRDGRPCSGTTAASSSLRTRGTGGGGHLGEPPPDLVPQHRPGGAVAIVNHLHTQAAAGGRCSTTSTPLRKRRRPGQGGYRPLLLPGDPGARWPSATPAAALPTVGPCRTTSPTPWSSPAGGYNAFALLYRPGGPDGLRRPGPGHHLRL